MSEDQQFVIFIEKLWEGVDALGERMKDAKKTTDEVKSRINNVSSAERENSEDLTSVSQKFNKITETGNLASIWARFSQCFQSMGLSLKGTSERILTLVPGLLTDIEDYVDSFEKGKDELPSLRKKKDRAIEDVQKARRKFVEAFKEWDVADTKYQQMKQDNKEKEKNKEKQEKKVKEYEKEKNNLLKNYEDKVKNCVRCEEDYNSTLKKFLSTCEKMEFKRLSLLLKTINDICDAYDNYYNTNTEMINNLKNSIADIDLNVEMNDFAELKSTKLVVPELMRVIHPKRVSESKKDANRGFPSATAKGLASTSSFSTGLSIFKEKFIKLDNPMVVYAAFDYTPTGDNDIVLKENNPYLLMKVDHPWEGWCQVSVLHTQEDENADPDIARQGPEKGCAPVNYFHKDYFEYAAYALKEALAANMPTPPPPIKDDEQIGIQGIAQALTHASKIQEKKSINKKTATVLYDYSDADSPLQIHASEVVAVLDDTNPDWILIKDLNGNDGYAPANHLQLN